MRVMELIKTKYPGRRGRAGRAPQQASPPAPKFSPSEGPERTMRERKILIVEDEANLQSLLRMCLSTEGYAIAVAGDGKEAMAALGRERFDVMLLDLAMPVMDGMTVLRTIRDLAPPRAVLMPPII